MEEAIAGQLAQPVFYVVLFGAFAGVALVLAVVGVYGVISYAVVRRSREIGLRMALGAGRDQIIRLVVQQGVRSVAVGGFVGLVGALGFARVLRSLLFVVPPADPLTFVLVAVLLLGVSVVACWIPARRAARADAMVSLRVE